MGGEPALLLLERIPSHLPCLLLVVHHCTSTSSTCVHVAMHCALCCEHQ